MRLQCTGAQLPPDPCASEFKCIYSRHIVVSTNGKVSSVNTRHITLRDHAKLLYHGHRYAHEYHSILRILAYIKRSRLYCLSLLYVWRKKNSVLAFPEKREYTFNSKCKKHKKMKLKRSCALALNPIILFYKTIMFIISLITRNINSACNRA